MRKVSQNIFGMWIFLASETLLFASLFVSLTVYRYLYPQAFADGTREMNLWLGALNTALLLTSSWTLAVGLARLRKACGGRGWLLATMGLGLLFLGVKSVEYAQHFRDGLVPGWAVAQFAATREQPVVFLLVFLYDPVAFAAFGRGLGFILWIWAGVKNREWCRAHQDALENCGLYWHFVDVVWILFFRPCT